MTESKESDAKGATEEETRKISSIDSEDALGNERASEEHSGERQEEVKEEED
ncbi:MAG: hypothetical protein R3338_10675 [Thermoanaerobaculia bacterium]|nr:hypothetical protein [Thermoanaerobaculia bacterium]